MTKTVWGATCECCSTSFAAWPHWEHQADIPEPEVWENPTTCPICGSPMSWDSSDSLKPYIYTGYADDEIA